MALTADEERQVRALLKKESAQKQESILASKGSFKQWLKNACAWAIRKLTDFALEQLFHYVVHAILGF